MRTADSIEQSNAMRKSQRPRKMSPKSLANLEPYKWKPGESGNPGGKPRIDMSAVIARAVFENGNNQSAIYEALGKALLKGNAYVFKELAERGYGKMKELHEHNLQVQNRSDEELLARLTELTEKKSDPL